MVIKIEESHFVTKNLVQKYKRTTDVYSPVIPQCVAKWFTQCRFSKYLFNTTIQFFEYISILAFQGF